MKPISDLQLFPRLTRAEYLRAHGTQAPPWDKTRRIQRWFDPTANPDADALAVRQYSVFDPTVGRFRTMQVLEREAASPNLPGQFDYPKHRVAPTRAVIRSTFDGSESPLNPTYLCEEAEALALAAELGLPASAVRPTQFGGPWQFVWNGESRRLWVIDWKGQAIQASSLLMGKHKAGVGAPGHWDLSGAEPVWVSEVPTDTGEMDPRPEVEMPMRLLLPSEKLRQVFGGGWVVVGVESLTDRELLEAIHAAVVREEM